MKSKLRGFVVNNYVLNIPSVYAMIGRDGACGLGKMVGVCTALTNCYHAIGTRLCIDEAARRMGLRAKSLASWVKNCGVFVTDKTGSMFYFPYMRSLMLKKEVPSDEEFEAVRLYGCHYRGDAEAAARRDAEAAEDGELSKESDGVVGEKCAERLDKDESLFSQSIDNDVVTSSPYSNSKNNSKKDNNYTNEMSNNYISSSSSTNKDFAAAGAENTFKIFERKILDSVSWRKAVSEAMGVNLKDDDAARWFVKWMHNYCVSKCKMGDIRDENGILSYAGNLLVPGMRTRKCFDSEFGHFVRLQEQKRKAAEDKGGSQKRRVCHGTFERIINGMRIGLGDQPLPNDAPYQTDPDTRWSYISHRWVPLKSWDGRSEMEYYRSHLKNGSTLSVGDVIVNKILPNLHDRTSHSPNCSPK